jgi:hypothetical protein
MTVSVHRVYNVYQLCSVSDFATVSVTTCNCETAAQLLVKSGLFPTTPSQPRFAVAIDLLDFYRALFERSCNAINTMASALHSFYTQRGYHILDKKGNPLRDPFRRSLGYAIQWHDSLRVMVEKEVDLALENTAKTILDLKAPPQHTATKRILQQHCPACFGGLSYGRPLDQ